ncbi:aminotransferase, classes I and II [Rhodotorula toruloides]|uniref:Aminotransferase, classes I and II n=1 Tax=Rhodotorula toruloides TaxID=5286 RepID=A0A511KHK3_RHOTO|nr:aminotransferase, classes I and II [Rhodotorula toruloides]
MPDSSLDHLKQGAGKPKGHENDSEAHRLFRSVPGHERRGAKKTQHDVAGIVAPGQTGVIYVSDRAMKNGWSAGDPEWANFGQGAPEGKLHKQDMVPSFAEANQHFLTVSHIDGSSPRPDTIKLSDLSAAYGSDVNEYAPTTGMRELREAVAKYYNETYRKGKPSQYTADNVCIVPGGRAGLTRVAAVVGDVFVCYSIPEYTSYDQLLSSFKRLVPIPTTLKEEDAYHLNVENLAEMIHNMGITCVFLSNPHNPTGQVIYGDELKRMVEMARKGTTMVLDEFYESYVYDLGEGAKVSAAEYIEDVNQDNVILINGMTKCWRLPGWRVCWVVGPESLIKALGQSGGFLDGGAPHPLQAAAIPLLDPARFDGDRIALQNLFRTKRDYVLKRLRDMGFVIEHPPTATFYLWLDLSSLPKPLNSGLVFFEEALKEKVIVVPGQFFDLSQFFLSPFSPSPSLFSVSSFFFFFFFFFSSSFSSKLPLNLLHARQTPLTGAFCHLLSWEPRNAILTSFPSRRRNLLDSPCDHFVRLSFGPPMPEIERGMDNLERLIKRVKKHVEEGTDLETVIGKDLKK